MMKEDIIINTDEDELFCLFHSILYRINLKINPCYPELIEKENFVIGDKQIIDAIREAKEDLKR